jgi:hypothetical protein
VGVFPSLKWQSRLCQKRVSFSRCEKSSSSCASRKPTRARRTRRQGVTHTQSPASPPARWRQWFFFFPPPFSLCPSQGKSEQRREEGGGTRVHAFAHKAVLLGGSPGLALQSKKEGNAVVATLPPVPSLFDQSNLRGITKMPLGRRERRGRQRRRGGQSASQSRFRHKAAPMTQAASRTVPSTPPRPTAARGREGGGGVTERPRPCGVRRTHQNAVRNTNAQRNTDAPLYEKKSPLSHSEDRSFPSTRRPRGTNSPSADAISTTPSPPKKGNEGGKWGRGDVCDTPARASSTDFGPLSPPPAARRTSPPSTSSPASGRGRSAGATQRATDGKKK